ncbi:MAG: hydrogenase maturation peptidase HycI [Candidatus Omnitrophica bacterium]|nr:hydrogenase maturation peptidase HycI [Candidatus Omnitrophota bacterium]MCM8807135.1 hydrogenase maturation peptidase HycI [Candidatus Omnitrophota bacterium]
MDRLLKKIKKGEKLVILGIGNRLKMDDGVGSIIAEKLKSLIKNKNIVVIDAENKPENYIGFIKKVNPSIILVIDACDFGASAGNFKIFKIDEIKDITFSTHNISISLLKNFLPEFEIYLLGIQFEKIGFGEKISQSVSDSIEKIINLLKPIL